MRQDGDAEAADEIKALKKPSEPAWAVNQLARKNKREVNKLLKSGERLRKVQGGGAKRDELRKAIAAERDQVARLAELAKPLLGARPEAKLERVRAVLHSAAGDEATREAITAGRLVEDKEAIGLGLLGDGGGSAGAGGTGKSAGARKRDKAAARRAETARKELDRARLELNRLRDQAQEVAKALEAAERRVNDAEGRLEAS